MKIFLLGLMTLLLSLSVNAQNTRPIYVGERVYNIQRDSVIATVIGIEPRGTFVLRFEEGPLAGGIGGNWSRADLAVMDGCGQNQNCVGDTVINNERNWVYTRVVGIQVDGRMVLEFLTGPGAGGRGANWNAFSLSKTQGCGNYFCVGQRAYNKQRNYALTEIIGIQWDGRYVLRYLTGPYTGQVGGNWNASDLEATY